MAQSVKCLPIKHKDMALDSHNLHRKMGMVTTRSKPRTGMMGRDTGTSFMLMIHELHFW